MLNGIVPPYQAYLTYQAAGQQVANLYSGVIANNEWLIGKDKTLNPENYFIVITALFGNGESSSPSNRPEIRPWPEVLFYDNVRAQHELVTKKLGKDHARAVLCRISGSLATEIHQALFSEETLHFKAGDCSAHKPYNGDFAAAMKAIKAKALALPCQTDLYFPPEDSEIEVANMSPGISKCVPFPSIWGHWAGGPGDSIEDVEWLDMQLRDFFAEN